MEEVVSADTVWEEDRSSHEEDCDDKVVSVALQPETFYERVSRLVRVEGTRVTEIRSVKVVEQVTCVDTDVSQMGEKTTAVNGRLTQHDPAIAVRH